MIERMKCCPVCGNKMLAREGMNEIFCLSASCTWTTKLKRDEDKDIIEIHETKDNWHY
jgi:hypothetical protein